MQKTNSQAEANAEIERMEALKKRAARQAGKRELAPEIIPTVECTVLPLGDSRISTGDHVGGLGTVHYEEGETFTCPVPAAVQHYVRGWVSFDGAREAVAEFKLQREHEVAADRASKAALDRLLESAAA